MASKSSAASSKDLPSRSCARTTTRSARSISSRHPGKERQPSSQSTFPSRSTISGLAKTLSSLGESSPEATSMMKTPTRLPDLRSRQPNSRRRIHGLRHILQQTLKGWPKVGDGLRNSTKSFVRIVEDLPNRHAYTPSTQLLERGPAVVNTNNTLNGRVTTTTSTPGQHQHEYGQVQTPHRFFSRALPLPRGACHGAQSEAGSDAGTDP